MWPLGEDLAVLSLGLFASWIQMGECVCARSLARSLVGSRVLVHASVGYLHCHIRALVGCFYVPALRIPGHCLSVCIWTGSHRRSVLHGVYCRAVMWRWEVIRVTWWEVGLDPAKAHSGWGRPYSLAGHRASPLSSLRGPRGCAGNGQGQKMSRKIEALWRMT